MLDQVSVTSEDTRALTYYAYSIATVCSIWLRVSRLHISVCENSFGVKTDFSFQLPTVITILMFMSIIILALT